MIFKMKSQIKKKKVYIHIGSHKTGTTSIQASLFDNRRELKRDGYHIVCSESPKRMMDRGNSSGFIKKGKIKKFPTNKNVIISSEFLFNLNAEEIKEFIAGLNLNKHEVKVIVYLRNQVDFYMAMKSQGAKNPFIGRVYGHNYSDSDFLVTDEIISYMDYLGKVEEWEKNVGINNVIVKIFDRTLFKNGCIVSDFCGVIGLPSYVAKTKLKENESLSYDMTCFLHDNQRIYKLNSGVRFKLLPILLENAVEGTSKAYLDFKKAKYFSTLFEESNRVLSDRYGLDFNRLKFTDSRRYIKDFNYSNLDLHKSEALFFDLLSDLICEMIKSKEIGKSDVISYLEIYSNYSYQYSHKLIFSLNALNVDINDDDFFVGNARAASSVEDDALTICPCDIGNENKKIIFDVLCLVLRIKKGVYVFSSWLKLERMIDTHIDLICCYLSLEYLIDIVEIYSIYGRNEQLKSAFFVLSIYRRSQLSAVELKKLNENVFLSNGGGTHDFYFSSYEGGEVKEKLSSTPTIENIYRKISKNL